jgi:hypothetical protein
MMVGMFDGMSFKKIKRAKIGGESFRDKLTAVWFELMDFAGKCNHDGAFVSPSEIPFTDLSDIAIMIDRDEEELKLCMAFFIKEGMITVIDDVYSLSNWAEYQNIEGMEKIRESKRLAQARWRAKQKALPKPPTVEPTVEPPVEPTVDSTRCNVDHAEEDIEKEIDKEIDKKNSAKQPSKADVNAFFESIWELYPVKKGKASVSDTKRKALYKIGYEAMEKAIDRYLAELKKDASWRKPQNGSTFFNSGYVDYLDENFEPNQTVHGGRKEKLPDWFGKRELDADERAAIQRMMSDDDQAEAEQLRRELQASFGRSG